MDEQGLERVVREVKKKRDNGVSEVTSTLLLDQRDLKEENRKRGLCEGMVQSL